jgi:hypothetical protein
MSDINQITEDTTNKNEVQEILITYGKTVNFLTELSLIFCIR